VQRHVRPAARISFDLDVCQLIASAPGKDWNAL
jgi:hypothetical protein